MVRSAAEFECKRFSGSCVAVSCCSYNELIHFLALLKVTCENSF